MISIRGRRAAIRNEANMKGDKNKEGKETNEGGRGRKRTHLGIEAEAIDLAQDPAHGAVAPAHQRTERFAAANHGKPAVRTGRGREGEGEADRRMAESKEVWLELAPGAGRCGRDRCTAVSDGEG